MDFLKCGQEVLARVCEPLQANYRNGISKMKLSGKTLPVSTAFLKFDSLECNLQVISAIVPMRRKVRPVKFAGSANGRSV